MLAISFDSNHFINIRKFVGKIRPFYNKGSEFKTLAESPSEFYVLKSRSLSAAFIGMYELESVLDLLCSGITIVLTEKHCFNYLNHRKLRQYRYENFQTLPNFTIYKSQSDPTKNQPDKVFFYTEDALIDYNTYCKGVITKKIKELIKSINPVLIIDNDYYITKNTPPFKVKRLLDELGWIGLAPTLEKIDNNLSKVTIILPNRN